MSEPGGIDTEGGIVISRLDKISLPLILIVLASPVYAGAPLDGVYTSAAGDLLVGRYSESWITGTWGALGNTLHAQSWDGAVLGTQWEVACPVVAAPPVLIEDLVDGNGNGHRSYRVVYSGGEFWFVGDGPWGNGDPDYWGLLVHYVQVTTFQYVDFVPVSWVTNIELSGYFDGYGECMQLTIANSTGDEGKSGDYPTFLVSAGGDCAPDPTATGELGDVHSIILIVLNCGTGNELATWGSVKSLYR